MEFESNKLLIKISVSNMLQSKLFYERILGFKMDDKYTINVGKTFAKSSYMQLNLSYTKDRSMSIGLFKDIDAPFKPIPLIGTAPTFIVEDIKTTLRHFQDLQVVIDKKDSEIIISNSSDEGHSDLSFFFRDPDNNSLVVRQYMRK